MRNKQVAVLLLLLISVLITYCTQEKIHEPLSEIKSDLLLQHDSLNTEVNKLSALINTEDTIGIKMAFLKTRKSYKKLEWFCEYYAPGVSREINGPPLAEIETEETKFAEPSGFQVIEEQIYPWQPDELETLKREMLSLKSSLARLKTIIEDTELTDAHVFDACKLEIFRVEITGITGFDTPLSFAGIDEAACVLTSVSNVLRSFGVHDELQEKIYVAVNYIYQHQDFDQFNRMDFITTYANGITEGIVKWQKTLNIKRLDHEQALKNGVGTLFDHDMFNVNHFVNSSEAMPNQEKTQLGKALFSDPIVSGSSRTCKSCHNPSLAFTDGIEKSIAIKNGQFLKRNAPTLLYAGLQNAQFYDMRFQTLENQAMDVISNKDEMHGSVEEAALRLQQHPEYYRKFKEAFPTMAADIKPRFVMMALASYVRSLTPFDSRFDEYMRGNKTKLNEEEVEGFNIFMGKAKCATCHFLPLFNGTAGPVFANTEGEVIGVLKDPASKTPVLDSDEGRYLWIKMDQLKFAFKTPTLRNVALTAPYMHNGAYKTLEQVMDLYNNGGATGIGLKLDNQTLAPDSLHLTYNEIKKVISFLKTLTDNEVKKTVLKNEGSY
jgi:cytochrome c peroxidase